MKSGRLTDTKSI